MEITNRFLVVLGESTDDRKKRSKDILESIGEIRQILNNAFVLKVNNLDVKTVNVREALCKTEFTPVIVIQLDDTLSCAWATTKEDSDFFKNEFEMISKEQNGK